MKSKILTLMLFSLFLQNVRACPSWPIGRMLIVDETGKPIPNAIVWKCYTQKDSFIIKKYNYDEVKDTNIYTFWSRSYYTYSRMLKTFRITAKGFADVVIKDLNFINSDDDEDKLPLIVVTMYTNKYVKRGDLLTLLTSFKYETKLEVKDSVVLKLSDYLEAITDASLVSEASRVANYVVKTYPNPVKDILNIDINLQVTKPYNAKLLNAQGQLLSEVELNTQINTIDMQWQTAGVYFIQVYNPEGVLLYAFKFIKI
jgi:hypothetical protein